MLFIRISSKIACAVALAILGMETHILAFADTPTPQVPETSQPAASVEIAANSGSLPDPQTIVQSITKSKELPVRLIIPSIKLDVSVQQVGVNAKGEMDVPDGKSANVGWYNKGTIPGEIGSAVMDAHVYAAFKKLRYVKVGDDIFVVTKSAEKLDFRAEDSRVYLLRELTPEWLFNRQDKKRLNLITCAGSYIPRLETYNKRLVVYAVLVDE